MLAYRARQSEFGGGGGGEDRGEEKADELSVIHEGGDAGLAGSRVTRRTLDRLRFIFGISDGGGDDDDDE